MVEFAPPEEQIDTYFATLHTRLANVPELQSSLELAVSQPDFSTNVYLGYAGLIGSMAELRDNGRKMIRIAKECMLISGGNFGTASEVSADDILSNLGESSAALLELCVSSASPESPYFTPALDELVKRMEGGHRLKLSGKTPSDGDPESGKVIWGHTMITDPNALVYFTVAHYMERYFSLGLADLGSELAQQKDFMLNALIDVLLVEQLGQKKFQDIYTVWRAPKDQGGLGWITNDRVESFESAAT